MGGIWVHPASTPVATVLLYGFALFYGFDQSCAGIISEKRALNIVTNARISNSRDYYFLQKESRTANFTRACMPAPLKQKSFNSKKKYSKNSCVKKNAGLWCTVCLIMVIKLCKYH